MSAFLIIPIWIISKHNSLRDRRLQQAAVCASPLWGNEDIEEPEIPFTVTLLEDFDGVPRRWRLRRIETPEGQLDRHCFGPFLQPGDRGEVHEIMSCTGTLWGEAAALLGSVWPILTGDDSDIPF